ncbi:MAG: GGDEF domain-containing protein, partial [Lachnospiraceae bacterium]|nr:GGDEF domain-containing protein [Lachnospiraceae bacterium]
PCWVSLLVIALSLFLQYFNLADFRQFFFAILAQLTFAIAAMTFMAVREIFRSGWSPKIRKNILGLALVVAGFGIDVWTYYSTRGKQSVTSYAIVGFLIYVIALGVSIFRENSLLISAGKGAQSMENLAYHDKMTGLFNRAAFIVDTDPYVVDAENFVVAVLDLNNLKYCNDHLGHEAGDRYIRDASKIIQNTFGTIGSCYRMGGDEFYCLIPKGGKASCREQQTRMENMIEEYNKTSDDVKIAIACGFARYDNRIDYDLNSTAKRADQLMYQNKEEMKKHEHEQELEREELERIAQEDMWE